MAPTIVTRADKPVLALGSPGGSTIITTVLQILIERIDLGGTLPEAIAAPRAAQGNSMRHDRRAGVQRLAPGPGADPASTDTSSSPLPEIGAATGIEFRRRGGLLAAAEP